MSSPLHLECPQFERCTAAFCPLTANGKHLRDEPVCLYLREAVKVGGDERVRRTLPAQLAERINSAARELFVPHSMLYRQLKRASKQASKLEIGHRIRSISGVALESDSGQSNRSKGSAS
jgi:hypothetical protein